MRIGDILYYQQPDIFDMLHGQSEKTFEPKKTKSASIKFVEQPDYPEDDPEFRKFRDMTTEKRAVQL